MKKQLALLAFIIGISLTNAQETEKPIQKNQFNFMRNFESNLFNEYDSSKNDYTFGYQRNINKDVSIGININYNSNKGYAFSQYNNMTYRSEEMNFKSLGVAANFNYDWSRILGLNTDKFDLYSGVSLGFSKIDNYYLDRSPINGLPTRFSKYNSNELILGSQIGFRYWITKNIGVSSEINKSFYNSNYQQNTKFNIGLNYKF